MLFELLRARVRDLSEKKKEVARFTGMLFLRKQQVSTFTRAAVANAIGYSDDQEEFDRRVNFVYKHGLAELFKESEDLGEPPNLRPRDLRKAIAKIGDVSLASIPTQDVVELVKKYDPDKNGIDFEEFKTMIHDLTQVHVAFTGHELMEHLSLKQLRGLRAHDWSMPVPDYRVCLLSPLAPVAPSAPHTLSSFRLSG